MRKRGARKQRRGFALLAVLVVVVIMLVTAVVGLTSVAAVADHGRIDLTSTVLMTLMDSTRVGVTRFQADVGEYPGTLMQMRNEITNSERDICGATYSNQEVDEWGAPYVIRAVTTAGMWTGIGQARNTLSKDPAAGNPSVNNPHALVLTIDDVDERDARLLNTRIDPEDETSPQTEGRVRWGAANAEGRVVLTFRKTITQC